MHKVSYPRGYWAKLLAPDNGAAPSSGSSGGGTTGTTGTGANPAGGGELGNGTSPSSGTTDTGGANPPSGSGSSSGATTPEDEAPESGEGDDKKHYGIPKAQWDAMPKSAQDAVKDVAKYRRDLRETQTQLKKYTDAELTDKQKLERDREELETQRLALIAERRKTNITAAFSALASTVGAKYPELLALVAPSVGEIKLNDEDQPTNADKLVSELKKKYPELFNNPGNINGGTGNGNNPADVDTSRLFGGSRIEYAYQTGAGKKDS